MSTRSMVGEFTNKARTKFVARYCHFDGYLDGVGQTIVENWINKFNGDSQKVVEFLLSTKNGWSALAGTDFTLPPTWEADDITPRWYDDRPGEEPCPPMTEEHLADTWCEYAYLFDVSENKLYIYDLYSRGASVKKLNFIGVVSPEYPNLPIEQEDDND